VSVGTVGEVESTALAYRLPIGTVLEMTLMGRYFRLAASRAHDLGLVDEIVPRQDPEVPGVEGRVP
jgi:enoyl-CoA hydratase/carnithine racemase